MLATSVALGILLVPLAHADGLVWYRVADPSTAAQPTPAAPQPALQPASLPTPPAAAAAALQSPSQAPAPTAPFSAGSHRYAPLIADIAKQYNIDPMLMHAVIHVESAYNERALSSKGAVGLMQLMPATAQRFGKTELYQPRENLEAGAAYLQALQQRFGGQLNLVLAGYNAGENAVLRNGNTVPPYPETQAYVQRVLAYYTRLKGGGVGQEWSVPKTMTATARTASASTSRWNDLGKLAQLLMSSGADSAQTNVNDTSNLQ
ncbi:lytic transglycosylase domain-containing protein [Dyella sp. M7H15-1]|nr:lytic transglycosylase domain-containing protein [Dyella sp. M7H15-1]